MNTDEIFGQFRPWFERHTRTAWKPIVEEADGALTASKFSGMPCLPDAIWPVCGSCNLPMQLFLQLNLSELPDPNLDYGTGLLQLFLCTNESDECCTDDYGDPFAKSHLVRIVEPNPSPSPVSIPSIDNYFPAKTIVSWSGADDYPSHPESEGLGLVYDSDDILKCPELNIEVPVLDEEYFEWSHTLAFPGNKLSGWPTWVQNVEYADCPKCGKQMDTMIFQIACDDNIPFMLADGGIGQIIQCPQHKDVLAFVWASG